MISPRDFAQSVENIYHLLFALEFSLEDFENVTFTRGEYSCGEGVNGYRYNYSQAALPSDQYPRRGRRTYGGAERERCRWEPHPSVIVLQAIGQHYSGGGVLLRLWTFGTENERPIHTSTLKSLRVLPLTEIQKTVLPESIEI